MTKKKEPGKNKKRINQTAHQRAMTNHGVWEAFSALQINWNNLSPQQRGQQLKMLSDSGCSVRGIADELRKPATTLRRYIEQANPATVRNDWDDMLERTLAKEPPREDAIRARATALHLPPEIPANQGVEQVIKETYPARDHAQPSKPQQLKKITPPSLTTAKEPAVVKSVVNGQEDRAEEDGPKKSLPELYKLGHPSNSERIRQLAAMPKSIEARPFRDARSMKRQGRPLPPTDPT